MRTFNIFANGTDMGDFEADSMIGAFLAYVQSAGYSSVEEAAKALGQSESEFLKNLVVRPA